MPSMTTKNNIQAPSLDERLSIFSSTLQTFFLILTTFKVCKRQVLLSHFANKKFEFPGVCLISQQRNNSMDIQKSASRKL
jgi:hypothetical protein